MHVVTENAARSLALRAEIPDQDIVKTDTPYVKSHDQPLELQPPLKKFGTNEPAPPLSSAGKELDHASA
jgi:hypothetical protein